MPTMISPRPATIAKTPAATIPHPPPCSPLSAVFMGWLVRLCKTRQMPSKFELLIKYRP